MVAVHAVTRTGLSSRDTVTEGEAYRGRPGPPRHRFLALDALRGLCAVLVCLFHFHANSPIATSAFIRSSWQFVDFFFVLSGFVIASGYRQRLRDGMSRARFLGLRLGRIYPLHIVMLLLFVVAEFGATLLPAGTRTPFDSAHSLSTIPLHLTMLHSVGLVPRLTWNDPAWSIATEFWAYVGFALLVPWARKRLDLVLGVVVVVCPLILLAVTPWGTNVTFDWGLVRCFYGFALGVLCWTAWQRMGAVAGSPTVGGSLIEMAALIAVTTFVVAADHSRWTLFGPPVFAVAVLVFAHERGFVSRLLTTPPLLALGTLSYSIYMTHSFVQARLVNLLQVVDHGTGIALTRPAVNGATTELLVGASPLAGTILTVVMLVTVVAVSVVTYRLVELPAQRWTRARLAAPPVTPAARSAKTRA